MIFMLNEKTKTYKSLFRSIESFTNTNSSWRSKGETLKAARKSRSSGCREAREAKIRRPVEQPMGAQVTPAACRQR